MGWAMEGGSVLSLSAHGKKNKLSISLYAFTNRLLTFTFFIPVHDHVADETYALARAIPNDEYSYARVFPGKSGDAPLTVLIFLGFTLI